MYRLTSISIRTRLLVAYIGIILLGLSGLTLIAGGQISSAVRADYEQHLQDSVRLVAQGLGAVVGTTSLDALDQSQRDTLVKAFEGQVDGSLSLFMPQRAPTSRDNDGPNGRGESFYNMPEMETAIRGQTIIVERKNESGENMFYTAAPLNYQGKPIAGIVRLSVPSQKLQSIVFQRWGVLWLGCALLTSLAVVAALALSRSIIQPLYKLRDTASRFSKGDLSHRVTFRSKDEIAEVGHAFNDMADQVQSMLEEQRAFASNAAHELRTPLTAIRLRTEALRYENTLDPTTTAEYIEEIDNEIAHLSNLVQDLSLLSRFDAGRAELGKEEIDLTRLANRLFNQVSSAATEKKIELRLSAPEVPVMVKASLTHLTVVFRNLLDNSLKYSPNGGTITWSMAMDTNGVTHTIEDTGQGIPLEHLPRVFDRFYRADKARSRDIPGTGLGLALVKSIITAYGGYITVESDGAGKGTTATVFWPMTSPPPHA